MAYNLIAFAGYARAGKSTAADALVDMGYKRVAFGDIIKRQIDSAVREKLGFSAFTENDDEKRKIRPLMEQWGSAFYESILTEFLENLPEKAVNMRLVRLEEATAWTKRGGIIVEIRRPGYGPATDWEHTRLQELRSAGMIHSIIEESDWAELRKKALAFTR